MIMAMFLRKILIISVTLLLPLAAWADWDPKATYIGSSGEEVSEWEDIEGEAPLHVHFDANASNLEAGASIEWHIRNQLSGTNLTRYDDSFDHDFTEAGDNVVSLILRQDNEAVDSVSITITISESHLEMPNAFSPNGDGKNDLYGAKGVNDSSSTGRYKSIVDFHAYIFNRHGQKLYEWHDVAGSWDGTYKGHPCKDGVYFVYVKARGADGRTYNIRRDVNLIRKHNDIESSTTTP